MEGRYRSLAYFHFRQNGDGQWPPPTPLTPVYMQTEKVSLILTGVLKRFCVCRLVEGIVSLSQLSHQGAVLNGHRIKATSLRKQVNTHLHEFGHTTLFSSKHTHFSPCEYWNYQVFSNAAWFSLINTTSALRTDLHMMILHYCRCTLHYQCSAGTIEITKLKKKFPCLKLLQCLLFFFIFFHFWQIARFLSLLLRRCHCL